MIIKTSPDEIQNYLSDASNFKGFCDAVYFPENEADISEILKEASTVKIYLLPFREMEQDLQAQEFHKAE